MLFTTLITFATPALAAHLAMCDTLCLLQSSDPCANSNTTCKTACTTQIDAPDGFYALDPLTLPYLGDSQSCRLAHTAVAHAYKGLGRDDFAIHCRHGDPSGADICVAGPSRCEIFCATYFQVTCAPTSIFGGVYGLLGAGYNTSDGYDTKMENMYASEDACKTACADYEAGITLSTAGDTYACREYHLGVASGFAQQAFVELLGANFNASKADVPALLGFRDNLLSHCAHAHATSYEGACAAGKTEAELFCKTWMSNCVVDSPVFENVTAYASEADCITKFNMYDAGEGIEGNTQGCRKYHLDVAMKLQGANRAAHCSHSDPTGATVCVEPTTTTTQADDDDESSIACIASVSLVAAAASLF